MNTTFDQLVNKYVNVTEADVPQQPQDEQPQGNIQQGTNANDLIALLKSYLSKGATFGSFYYKSKTSGGSGIYTVNFNVDYKRAKEEDMQKLRDYQPETELETQAKESILNPKQRKVAEQPYVKLGQGVMVNTTNDKIHIFGFPVNYEEITPAVTPKKGAVGELTKAKEDLKKKLGFKSTKIRNFILDADNIAGLKLKGDLIEFQNEQDNTTAA
jgi:hypothetical protein